MQKADINRLQIVISLPVRLAVSLTVAVVAIGCATPRPPAITSETSPSFQPPSEALSPGPGDPPVWAFDLEGQLQCDGPAQSTGGELGDLGPEEGSRRRPQDALAAFLGTGIWATFPRSGFEPWIGSKHWARHEYLRDGRIRALAVSTDLEPWTLSDGTWTVVAIRACDPSEFDPADGATMEETLWQDAAGTVVRSDTARAFPGPGHCGWESTLWLRLGDRLYLRDPQGVLDAATVVPFQQRAKLPDDAIDTGLRSDAWHLFGVPADDAVYVRTASGEVERWGRALDPMMGCA